MGKAVTQLNTPNSNTNFVVIEAEKDWKITYLPFKASTAIEEGSAIGIEIVTNAVTGNVTLMGVENAAGADFVGIMAEPIVATDTDYATAGKLKAVYVPKSIYSRAKFTVGAGTFTAVDVFKTVQFGSNSKGLDVDTAGKGARIVEYTSATEGVCSFPFSATETA